MLLASKLKRKLKRFVPRRISHFRRIMFSVKPIADRACPICHFEGKFEIFGIPPRLDALCPNCDSLERHRLLFNALTHNKGLINAPVLHFAAEKVLESYFRKTVSSYETADLYEHADLRLNIEKIDLESDRYKTVIANHVLEHVDDFKACNEIHRILQPNGIFIAMVPIVEGWTTTYENNHIPNDEHARMVHFGQGDHVRFYGRDFTDRVEKSGLKLTNVYCAEGEDVIKYGLVRGEKVFVFQKTN